MLLERTEKIYVNSEEAAQKKIEEVREEAKQGQFYVKKSGYEYKCKKSKGEIIAERWVVTYTKVYTELWEDLV